MEYLRRFLETLVPPREEPAPADVEAHWCGGEQSIVIVTDAADVRVQVRPLMRASDLYGAVNAV